MDSLIRGGNSFAQAYNRLMQRLWQKPEGAAAWLFDGNLTETARKCEAEERIAEKMVKQKGHQIKPGNGAARAKKNSQQKRGASMGSLIVTIWLGGNDFPLRSKTISYIPYSIILYNYATT